MKSRPISITARYLTLLGLSLIATISSSTFAGSAKSTEQSTPAAPYFNEVYDENGQVRPPYQEILPIYKALGARRRAKFRKQSQVDFQGDNPMDPLPRMVSDSERAELKRGTEQRGNAIRLFLQAYYSGDHAVVEKIIPKAVLQRIVNRTQESAYFGHVSPDLISFPYGPDIIRDANGSWRVLEDNIGPVGGFGDLQQARESLLKRIPEYKDKIHAVDRPEDFYDDLVANYRAHRNPPDGKIVLYGHPPYPDREDARLKKIFTSRGVEFVSPFTAKKLITTDRGVFLEEQGPNGTVSREKVGYVIFGYKHSDVDSRDPLTQERALVEWAQEWLSKPDLERYSRKALNAALIPDKKTGRVNVDQLDQALDWASYRNPTRKYRRQVKGLVDAMVTGKVGTDYSPGIDFASDKEFYMYVPEMIRQLVHEEPLLENVPTYSFAKTDRRGKVTLNREVYDRVFANPKQYVTKPVDGQGGTGVRVGPAISAREFSKARTDILAAPERYNAQDFTHLSVSEGMIGDYRMLAQVSKNGTMVSSTPWARNLSMNGDGKVNISSSGGEVAVIVTRDRAKELNNFRSEKVKCFSEHLQ